MKTLKLLLGFLFLTATGHAAADRFGNQRSEIPRSSFTNTADLNVVIASVTSSGDGSLVIRSVTFSGVNSDTVTFYDANIMTANISTKTSLSYVPVTGGNFGGSYPTVVPIDVWCSSAIMYTKVGTTPVQIKWDWLTKPAEAPNRP